MFCWNCGTENENEATFCKDCGEALQSERKFKLKRLNIKKPANPAALKKRNIITICVAIAILMLGSLGGYAVYSNTGSRLVEKQLSLGEKYLSELNYEAAIVAFTKVISVDPKNVNAYLGLADAYVGEGEPEKAVETLNNAVSEIPKSADLYSKLADIYISQDDYQNAAVILQKGFDATGDAGLGARLQDEMQEKPQESKQIEDIEFTVDASSIYKENEINTPLGISDGNKKTAWVEASDSNGVGEWITFSSDSPFDLDSIQMMNGYSKSESLYYKNNRVAKLQVIASNGESKELDFKDGELDFQEFDVGFKAITSIKLVIEEVYEGTAYNDLCISEIMLNNELLNLKLSENNKKIISKLQQDKVNENNTHNWKTLYSEELKKILPSQYGDIAALADLDFDGIPELLVGSQIGSGGFSVAYAAYTVKNGKLISILDSNTEIEIRHIDQAKLYYNSSTNQYRIIIENSYASGYMYHSYATSILSLNNGIVTETSVISSIEETDAENVTRYTYMVNDSETTKEAYDQAEASINDGWNEVPGFKVGYNDNISSSSSDIDKLINSY